MSLESDEALLPVEGEEGEGDVVLQRQPLASRLFDSASTNNVQLAFFGGLLLIKFLHDNMLVSSLFITLQIAQYKLSVSVRERLTIRSRRGHFLLRSLSVSVVLASLTLVLLSLSPKALFPGAFFANDGGHTLIADRLLLLQYGNGVKDEITIMSCIWLCLNIDLLATQCFTCVKLLVALLLHMQFSCSPNPNLRDYNKNNTSLWRCTEECLIDRSAACRSTGLLDFLRFNLDINRADPPNAMANITSIPWQDHRKRDPEAQREEAKGKAESPEQERKEAMHFLQLKKVMLLIDVSSLTYRSLLPIPVWYSYFGGGGVLPSLYLFMKAADLFEKIGGLGEAVKLATSNAFEFGRAATSNEATGDCPICFDRLSNPVALHCNHYFCAHCIGEWVDRTGSCPICRSAVQSSFRFLRKIRTDNIDATVVC